MYLVKWHRNSDGRVDKVRVSASIATGVLAVANVWVEYDKRKDIPGAFGAYLKEAAKDAVSLSSLAIGGAIMAAAATPLGPVVMFTLGAVAGYAAIKNLVHHLATSDTLDRNGLTYKFVKHIDDSLTKFEAQIKSYIDNAVKEIKDGAEKILEKFTGRSIEWISEEAFATVVNDAETGKPDSILVGDDVSVLFGDTANDWLVHRSAGSVFGDKGDDVLIGWLPEFIRAGEAIGVELGASEVAANDNEFDVLMAQGAA